MPLCTYPSRSFESENLLTDHRKTEMAGFDDPCVTGPTGISCTPSPSTVTKAFAVDDGNGGAPGGVLTWTNGRKPSGHAAWRNHGRLSAPVGRNPEKIRHRALHAACAREPLLDVRDTRCQRQRQPQNEYSRPRDKRGSDDVLAGIVPACPQREQPAFVGRQGLRRPGAIRRAPPSAPMCWVRPQSLLAAFNSAFCARLIEPSPENPLTLPRSGAAAARYQSAR